MIGFRHARNLADAIAALTDLPSWRPVCGGTDVLVQRHFGRLRADGFVNLWGLLPRQINDSEHEIRLGAGVTCTELAESPIVRQHLFPLWEAARTMGSPQIRNRATLGGNIGNASPAADMAAALMAEEARVVIRGVAGDVVVPLGRVFVGPGKTTLKPGDLIVEIIVPKPPPSFARFAKLGFRRAQVIAAVSLTVRILGRPPHIEDARLAWGSVAPTPVRSPRIEELLRGSQLDDDLCASAVALADEEIAPVDDHRASAAYRRAVAKSYLRRALTEYRQWPST